MRIAMVLAVLLCLVASPEAMAGRGKGVMDLGPDLQSVLGDGFDAPPELTTRAMPGTVLQVTRDGYDTVKVGCVEAQADEVQSVDLTMRSDLAGGVSVRLLSVGGAHLSASRSATIQFNSPSIVGIQAADLTPSDDCVNAVGAYLRRGNKIGDMMLVQETLVAQISACTEQETKAEVTGPGGGGDGSTGKICQMFSEAPVAVGVKWKPLAEFEEFGGVHQPPPIGILGLGPKLGISTDHAGGGCNRLSGPSPILGVNVLAQGGGPRFNMLGGVFAGVEQAPQSLSCADDLALYDAHPAIEDAGLAFRPDFGALLSPGIWLRGPLRLGPSFMAGNAFGRAWRIRADAPRDFLAGKYTSDGQFSLGIRAGVVAGDDALGEVSVHYRRTYWSLADSSKRDSFSSEALVVTVEMAYFGSRGD